MKVTRFICCFFPEDVGKGKWGWWKGKGEEEVDTDKWDESGI